MKYKRYKKIFSLVLVLSIVLSNIYIYILSNNVFAAGKTKEEIQAEFELISKDWANTYDWNGTWKNSMITMQKDGIEEIAYCYDQAKKTPGSQGYGDHKYRKITLTNNNKELLITYLNSRTKSWWGNDPIHTDEEKIANQILYILSRGYPGNPNLKDELKAEFGMDFSDNDLYDGTQWAIWAVTDRNTTSDWEFDLKQTDKKFKVASYIAGINNGSLAEYKKLGINEPYKDGPLPSNIKLSFFDAEDTVKLGSNYWGAADAAFQPIIALRYVETPDEAKIPIDISVKKEWVGIPDVEIKNQPDVKINLKRDGKFVTQLILNNDNNWQVTYVDELSIDDGYPTYEIAEVGVDGGEYGEIHNGNSIVLSDKKTYKFNISGNFMDGFIVTNTLEGLPLKVSIKKVASDTNQNLSGANLRLSKLDGTVVKDGEWTTDGTDKEFKLEIGEYRLEEISVPEGYEKASDIVFRVTDKGKLELKQLDGSFSEESSLLITMVDKKLDIPTGGGIIPPSGGETTPPSGGNTTPPTGGNTTPPTGGNTTPPTGGETTPPTGGNTTPPTGGETTPPSGGNTTPPSGGNTTPPSGGETTPSSGGNTTPPSGGNTTPPSGGETTPSSGGNTTPLTGENTSTNKESNDKKKPSTPKPNVVNEVESNKNSSSIVDKNKKDDSPKKKTDSSKISHKEDSDNIDITASSSSSEQNFDPGIRKPEDKDKNSKVVKTSDSTKIVFYSSMVLISSLVIGFYIFDKKKK